MNVGDLVQWTHIVERGRTTIQMYAREGKIVAVNGDEVTVKHDKTGRTYTYPSKRIRPIDQRNELTEIVMGRPKHLFTDGTDTVAAENAEEATAIWENHVGDTRDTKTYPWRQIPDDENVIVYFEDDLKKEYLPLGAVVNHASEEDPMPDPWTIEVSAPAKEWAESRLCKKEPFLCSTEF